MLRNHFLFACEQVKITGAIRLRQVLEELLPVSSQHPLYNESKGGYPRGYSLFVHTSGPEKGNQCFKKGEQLSFSLVIYGYCDEYGEAFLQALTGMCRNGLNKGTIPLHLVCVSERQEDGSVQMLYHEDGGAFFQLRNPITLGRYIHSKMTPEEQTLSIHFDTLVDLYGGRKKIYKPGYVYRDHQFPGFYQLMLSAANRISKLTALYACSDM